MTGIINIFADDLRADEYAFMPHLRRLVNRGTRFTQMRQPTPMCNPARAAFLRGQAANGPNGTGVFSQLDGWTPELRAHALPQWLSTAEVDAGILGKHFLPVSSPLFSDGWSWIRSTKNGTSSAASAYGYAIWDGTETSEPFPDLHQEHYFARTGLDWVQERVAAGGDWFLWYATNSPHGPLVPTPFRSGRWAGQPFDLPASAATVGSSMPSWIRGRPLPTPGTIDTATTTMRQRLRECLDLDDWIGMVVSWLDATGHAADTHIMVWSDNGNGLLEHRANLNGKGAPYDWSMLTPLVCVGPGWPAGLDVDVSCVAPDVTATTAAILGATPTITLDGIDLRDVAAAPGDYADRAIFGGLDDNFSSVPGRPPCDILVTATHKLVRYTEPEGGWVDETTDPYELFDLAADPNELVNLAPTETALRDELETRLDGLLAGD